MLIGLTLQYCYWYSAEQVCSNKFCFLLLLRVDSVVTYSTLQLTLLLIVGIVAQALGI
jgi:hypothetical protein